MATTASVPAYLWDRDPDVDDALHNPDPVRDAKLDRSFALFSGRGWANAGALFILVIGLLTLFAGYPIIVFYTQQRPRATGFNLGGINGSGQIPDLPGLPALIDADTPTDAYTRTGTDGKKYNLVFSDEFENPGRSFYPGDDPFWEAVDFHYWPTGDVEWYDPSAVTTEDGKLVLTMTEENIHDLNFKSGMITSWNKMCFTTGYIEVSVSMPGSPKAPGFWPGAWTMGNLGRAGYGASTEGMWPYSYDTCDLGTFPNQTNTDGTTPADALTGGNSGGPVSFLPGQRLSACTCPGSDHPGPSTSTGRGVPEIDIIETQVDTTTFTGQVSQSYQIAPFNNKYNFAKSGTTIYDDSLTEYNSYQGAEFQQAVSAVTFIEDQFYNNTAYAPYGFEWWSDPNHRDQGYITWFSNNQKTWTVDAAAIGADSDTQISSRLISEEPMYVILNFGMSPGFQRQDYQHMQFPAKMYIDYVRVYQRDGVKDGLTCDPPNRPTADYIQRHIQAYTDANLTTWAQAGNTFPRNRLYDGC
ncbi:glycoside hydrolase family 16 protein [Dendrothele bispora CBS 962.96]|uniref:Glycoside hydrolase family 16 protein n=1 Tax=Dendrothele bispora (strain CBS 962.96) TaxID=1314807 RepID=A0A4S8MQ76_DENBC|nr:glycoside hydrolase family 16 protein [Dendrothele bispora CBS 962.96]